MHLRFALLTLSVFFVICPENASSTRPQRTIRSLNRKNNEDSPPQQQPVLKKRLIRETGDGDDVDEDEFSLGQLSDVMLGPRKPNGTGSNPDKFYIPENYDRLAIPKNMLRDSSEEAMDPFYYAVPVEIYLSIRKIDEIDEENEEITLEMDLIVEWMDYELQNEIVRKFFESNLEGELEVEQEQIALEPTILRSLWKPDIYIDNLVEVTNPKILTRPASLRFSKSGEMTYISRITAKIRCELDFAYYPADTQKCDVAIRSYSYNSTDLSLSWRKPEGVYLLDSGDDNFDIAVGALRRYRLDTHLNVNQKKKTNETYDVIQFTVFARRRLSYQLLQTYVPSVLYLGITWLCFMIPSKMIEARMAIAMTTLLTLTAMFASVRESTPVVSYIKAIDIWMVASVMFVFLILLEFAVLLWTDAANEEESKKTGEPEEEKLMEPDDKAARNPQRDEVVIKKGKPTFGQKLKKCTLVHCTKIITFVEEYSLVLILLLFSIFCIAYWSWLLTSSGYFDWHVNPAHNAVEDSDDDGHAEQIVEELKAL